MQTEINNLAERINAIISQKGFRASMELIEAKHLIGEEIVTDSLYKKYKQGSGALIKEVARLSGRSSQDLYFCVQFYLKYPELSTAVETLPWGNNITWTKIRNLLPSGKELVNNFHLQCRHLQTKTICLNCHKTLKII